MSDASLTVPTAFVDISQLAEGLADRVDEGRLMLYGPDSYEEGSWLRFAVLLEDQSAALEGVGRVVISIDGGEERPEVARWDVVLDNLQFDGMAEVVYERILMVRQSAFGDDSTGQVSVESLEEAPSAAEASYGAEQMEHEATAIAPSHDYADPTSSSAYDEPAAADPFGQPEEAGDYAHVAGETSVGAAPEGYGETSVGAAPEGYGEVPVDAAVTEQEAEAALAGLEVSDVSMPAEDDHASPWEPEGVTRDVDVSDVEDVVGDDLAEGAHAGGFGHDLDFPEDEHHEPPYVQPAQAVTQDASVPPSAPPPAPPSRPGGFEIAALGADGQVLARPSRGAAWYPEVVPPPEPRPSSGLFAFAGGLPLPPAPPRPDIDPSMRIRPAPNPQNGGAEAQVAGYDGGTALGAAHGGSFDLADSVEPDFEGQHGGSDWDAYDASTGMDISSPDDDERS